MLVSNILAKVTPVEITPMLPPQSGDKQPENMTRWLLDNILLYMVAEVLLLLFLYLFSELVFYLCF